MLFSLILIISNSSTLNFSELLSHEGFMCGLSELAHGIICCEDRFCFSEESSPMHSCILIFNKSNCFSCKESIEDRLGAMDIDVRKVKPTGGLPQTDNFAVLLVQGLESNDPEILNVSIGSGIVVSKRALYSLLFLLLFCVLQQFVLYAVKSLKSCWVHVGTNIVYMYIFLF